MPLDRNRPIGPILIVDDYRQETLHLAALFIMPKNHAPGDIRTDDGIHSPVLLKQYEAMDIWRTRFVLPGDRTSTYHYKTQSFKIAGDWRGDMRIAYVSCNGEEAGDLERNPAERNKMWSKIEEQHGESPFALLIHGGDQVYADEVVLGHKLSEEWPKHVPKDPSRAALSELKTHLSERFFERYATLYQAETFSWLGARVPSLMQWDDHDICDGWGSLPRSRTYSPVGQLLFEVARESFLLFQQATVEQDLPERFADPSGVHLGWRVELPNLRMIAPDLRSERTKRAIMGRGGWQMMEEEARKKSASDVFFLSSVPLLGPRLSLVELCLVLSPRMQKYEDDLRDQWQSRAHREEWQRILSLITDMIRGNNIHFTAISGEIHLAAQAEMGAGEGAKICQLVASGIAHRAPPKTWARFLHFLAYLGEDPLEGQPIQINRIPGQRYRYVAERNFLMLTRKSEEWSAQWNFEESGVSGPVHL